MLWKLEQDTVQHMYVNGSLADLPVNNTCDETEQLPEKVDKHLEHMGED